MLQCGKYMILNDAEHGFIAHSIHNYGHIASFIHFHLTNVSQCDHYDSVLNNSEMVILDQL